MWTRVAFVHLSIVSALLLGPMSVSEGQGGKPAVKLKLKINCQQLKNRQRPDAALTVLAIRRSQGRTFELKRKEIAAPPIETAKTTTSTATCQFDFLTEPNDGFLIIVIDKSKAYQPWTGDFSDSKVVYSALVDVPPMPDGELRLTVTRAAKLATYYAEMDNNDKELRTIADFLTKWRNDLIAP